MNKKVLAAITGLVLAVCFSSGAQEGARPIYADWPDTDPEWNALTNHITWCWNSLHERWLATASVCNYFPYVDPPEQPRFVCPYKDYMRLAVSIDRLAPKFIRQDWAQDGTFADFFSAKTNDEYRTAFPRWTPESLHIAAFGKPNWTTNFVLTSWMAVTNRSIVVEVETAIKLLKWTEECEFVASREEPYGEFRAFNGASDESFRDAVSNMSLYNDETNDCGYCYCCDIYNNSNDDCYYVFGSWTYGLGAGFDFWNCFDYADVGFYTNNIINYPPEVSCYFFRTISTNGYFFSEICNRQKVFFGGVLGVPQVGEVLVTYLNPFASIANVDLLGYAGLGEESFEDAEYHENGGLRWLLKWSFPDNSPDIPIFPPVEIRDSDRDDLVEIADVKWIPGSETGTFVLSCEDGSPWLYLPVSEPLPWRGRAKNAYLTVGSVTNLPYQYSAFDQSDYDYGDVKFPLELYDGPISAFSLNTRIAEVGVSTGENACVKQVLVVRPRGQPVIFEFAWEGDGFSCFGYPIGINRGLSYVLCYQLGWYSLVFRSGVQHHFWEDHRLWGISDADGAYYGCSYADVFRPDLSDLQGPFVVTNGLSAVTNGRFHVEIEWKRGIPVSVEYRSPVSGQLCERTEVHYSSYGVPNKAMKHDPLAEAEVDGGSRVVYGAGFALSRDAHEDSSGTRSASISLFSDSFHGGEFVHTKKYDSQNRLIQESSVYGQVDPLVIEYSYFTELERDEHYPNTGFLVRNSLAIIDKKTSFGTCSEYLFYSPGEGWLSDRVVLSGGQERCEHFEYDVSSAVSTFLADLWSPSVLHLRSMTEEIDGAVFSKRLFHSDVYSSCDLFMQVCRTPDSLWDDSGSKSYYSQVYKCDALHNYWGPGFSHIAVDCDEEYALTQLYARVSVNFSHTNTYHISNFGVDLYRKVQTFEGAVLEETVTEVDGKGRPVTSSFMDGTSVAFQDWCLHGPQKIINRDGSETALAYDPFGRVKRRVDGESGIVSEYEYDPMGRVTRQTRSAGGQQLESRWTYGLDGTLLYAKDESGHEVSFAGRYVNGLLELTRSETGCGDVVETFWADGTLKSVSGDGAAVRFSCERGITDNRLWIKKINPEKPGEWVKTWYAFNGLFDATERPGGIFDRVSFDSSLMPESSVSGDGVRRLFSHDHRHSSLPVFSGVALGGGDSLDLARDPCCLSNAYAFTAGGLQSSVFSFPEDGSGEPFESYSSSVSPDGLSGSFSAGGRPGNWFCDAPPSTGTFTKTVNLPDGSVETYVFRKFLLRKFIRRDADSMRKSTVTYRYDSFGALSACTTDARGFKETVSLGRDADRRLNAIRSSSRGTTVLHRDAASGRVSSIASPAGLTALGWLPCGELGSVRRDAGPLYSRTLDPFGRADSLTCRFSPAAASTLSYTYADDGGFSSKARDGVTQAAVTARRADGRPSDVSLPGGAAVSMTYDPAGRLTWESWSDPGNPGGSVSFNRKWHRDGRLRAAAQAGGAVLSNHVFRAGGMTVAERTDFRAPDSADTSVTVSLGGPGGRKDGVLVAAGGFSGMAMQTGAAYDGVGRVSHQWGDGFYVAYGGPSGGPVTNTCFSVGGSERMVRSVTWSASDGRPARVDYTLGGKLLRRWEYIAEGGRVRFVTRGGGDAYRTDYEYDWAGRLESAHSSVTNVAGGWRSFPGFSFSYAYTAAGDTVRFGPASHADSASASRDLHTGRSWSPWAGVLGRLSATNAIVTVSCGAATNGAEAAAAGVFYAPLDISGLSAPPGTATSGTALVTASFPGCTQDTARVAFSRPAPAETPVYSPRGFLLADSRRTYRWDAPGRLLAVTNTCPAPGCGGSVLAVACAYFPDGRRAAKTVSVCSNGVWSVKRRLEYCWDGWKLAAELERGPAGGIAAVRHFVWGLDVEGQASGQLDTGAEGVGGLVLIREWRAETGAVKRYLPVTDGLGSVCGLVDADTAGLAAEYDYSPYGEVIAEVGPAKDACPFRHRTRYYDSETWLYYYGYRYYDPSVTKWISKDPLGEAGGWNLTAFCGNDPVNTFDALGLFDLPTHANVTISAFRQMKELLGLTEEQFSELLRGAVEGSMYPDLQARPLIPKGAPLATFQDIDKVMGIIGYPVKKIGAAGKWAGGKVNDAQMWAVGLVWKDYPRIHTGLQNWWAHGPSFLGPICKVGADFRVPHMNALYQTHFGELSWQHGMGDAGMKAADVQAKMIAGSLANLAAYKDCIGKGNYYDAGFELGKTLHYLQDTYTPSHTERDPATGQIIAFYDYNVQSPTRHVEADKPGLDSAVFNTAVQQSQSLIGIFLKGNSGAISGLFQVAPDADIGIPGLRFRREENLISPFDFLRGDF